MSTTPVIGRFEVRGRKADGEPLLGSFSYTEIEGSHDAAQLAAKKRVADLRRNHSQFSEVKHAMGNHQ